jgi:predicted N-acetyltransferase YhbS
MTEDAENCLPIHFRLAEVADCARVVALVNSAFSIIETFFVGTRTNDQQLAEDMRKGHVLVAENGCGQLLGSVYAEVRGAAGYLGMLAVDPAHQRAHIGSRIVAAAEEHLRRQGCETAELVVLNLRPELPPIYRKFGYVESGVIENYPTPPLKAGIECHGIGMRKRL